MPRETLLLPLAIALLIAPFGAAEDELPTLDGKAKDVHRLEVSVGQLGFRNTLIFYTFAKQAAVLKVSIDNTTKKFPMTGTLYTFPKGTTEEALKKWLNNQHSDGLFVDVPEPVTMNKLPADAIKIVSSKAKDQVKQPFGTFENYAVEIEVKDVAKLGFRKIKGFRDTATVHLKLK